MRSCRLAEYDVSMFELRAVVEPFVCGDVPECVVLYLPGCERDRRGSVLMELEKAGERYEPQHAPGRVCKGAQQSKGERGILIH
jgi:hypothetical protein